MVALLTAVALCFGATLLPLVPAVVVFTIAALCLCIVYFAVPGNSADPALLSVLLMLVAIFLAYIASAFRGRVAHKRNVSKFFKHYVPSNLEEYYIDNPAGMDAVSDSRELTILFCDIKQFTTSRVIHQYGGTVDKYMGDSVMAFWGAPEASSTHATDSLYASRKIEEEVAVLSQQMQGLGLPPIAIGIGIATGYANVGHMGRQSTGISIPRARYSTRERAAEICKVVRAGLSDR